MSDIERMTAYLYEAETFIDTVYTFAQHSSKPSADQLRVNMNHIANILHESRKLLESMESLFTLIQETAIITVLNKETK